MPWDQGQPTTPGPSPRDGMSHRLAVRLTAASSSYLFRQEGLVVQVYLMSSGHSRVDLQISPHQTVGISPQGAVLYLFIYFIKKIYLRREYLFDAQVRRQ